MAVVQMLLKQHANVSICDVVCKSDKIVFHASIMYSMHIFAKTFSQQQ